MNPYIVEFLTNLDNYHYRKLPLNSYREMEFFLFKDHQVAYDEDRYNEFMSLFTSYFEYSDFHLEFLNLVNLFKLYKNSQNVKSWNEGFQYNEGDSLKFLEFLQKRKSV
jgi:hypothetical protein